MHCFQSDTSLQGGNCPEADAPFRSAPINVYQVSCMNKCPLLLPQLPDTSARYSERISGARRVARPVAIDTYIKPSPTPRFERPKTSTKPLVCSNKPNVSTPVGSIGSSTFFCDTRFPTLPRQQATLGLSGSYRQRFSKKCLSYCNANHNKSSCAVDKSTREALAFGIVSVASPCTGQSAIDKERTPPPALRGVT